MNEPNHPHDAIVCRDYVAQYPDPIVVCANAIVRVEREDPEFRDWWWCVAEDGRAGWVHAELLIPPPTPDATVRVRTDYSARELTVERGTPLVILDERSDWVLARTLDGTTGWLPASHVMPTTKR